MRQVLDNAGYWWCLEAYSPPGDAPLVWNNEKFGWISNGQVVVAKDVVQGGCAVPLQDVADAVRLLAERNRIVAEGAGACPVAAAMSGMCGHDKKKI